MNFELEKAVSDTLAYFSLFNCPLNLDELHARLHDVRVTKAELGKFMKSKPKGVSEREGYYTLVGKEGFFAERQRNLISTREKWDVLRPRIKLLRHVPFLRGLCVSGSVSAGNSDAESDIDIFVITRQNRIWLCRGFLAVFTKMLGWYRQEGKGEVCNKLCPNHFISEAGLDLEPRSVYTSHLYAQFAPVIGPGVCERMRKKNIGWMKKILPNTRGVEESPIGVWELPKFNLLEILLFPPIGLLAEHVAQKMQMKKLQSNPNYKEKVKRGGLKFSKIELTFHGRPQEPRLLRAFSRLQEK